MLPSICELYKIKKKKISSKYLSRYIIYTINALAVVEKKLKNYFQFTIAIITIYSPIAFTFTELF